MPAPADDSRPLRIGLLGLGTVGAAVARLLTENAGLYAERAGRHIEVGPVVVRNVAKARALGVVPDDSIGDDPAALDEPAVDVLVEVAGGTDTAKSAIAAALRAGRPVVTANKALLAADGPELFALAREHGACVAFEASCVAGVPVVAGLVHGLMSSRVRRLDGILNGTCNYIGTAMARDGKTYAEALADAKALGYAEADETLDVSGADAASKLAILASLAFGVAVRQPDVATAGIAGIDASDTRFAASMGFGIKLIASAIAGGDRLHLSTSPCLVADDHPLFAVTGSTNALCVEADPVGRVVMSGPGAGGGETAAGVISDLLGVATGAYPALFAASGLWPDRRPAGSPAPANALPGRFYLRVDVADEAGVVGRLASAFGAEGVSLSAFHQREAAAAAGDAVPVVLLTHATTRSSVDAACVAFAKDPAARGDAVVMRVLGREEA